jgi:hypothetical protein
MSKLIQLQSLRRRDWELLAGMGLLVPILLATLKGLVLHSTILQELHWGFIPLDGPIDGIWPHAFYRVMHDFTHPVLLIAYAVIFAALPLFARSAVSHKRRLLLVFSVTLLLHITLVVLYFASLFMPIGDPIEILKP